MSSPEVELQNVFDDGNTLIHAYPLRALTEEA
jgi:hypothetical protein